MAILQMIPRPIYVPMGSSVDLVVVFDKEISKEEADVILKTLPYDFKEGRDSGKGENYFYEHGLSYIVSVPDTKVDEAILIYEKLEGVFEVYKYNEIVKD